MKSLLFILLIVAFGNVFAAGGQMIQVQSGDEKISAYFAKPSGAGPFPALILIHEWWGLNDQIKSTADRFVAQGYAALAVDLYRGKVTSNPDEAHQYMAGLPEDRALRDLKAAFSYLQSQKEIKKDKIGSIGWCMGGGYSLRVAIEEPQLAACVIYYGRLLTDADTLKRIQAPILGIFGEQDQAITPDAVKKFDEQMKTLGKSVEVHSYPAGHGFFNETGKAYNKAAAEDAWSKTLKFLAQHLKG